MDKLPRSQIHQAAQNLIAAHSPLRRQPADGILGFHTKQQLSHFEVFSFDAF
jgi:hypothetical protein